jgi:hypothetical protein
MKIIKKDVATCDQGSMKAFYQEIDEKLGFNKTLIDFVA